SDMNRIGPPRTGKEVVARVHSLLPREDLSEWVEAVRLADPFPVVLVEAGREQVGCLVRTRKEAAAGLTDASPNRVAGLLREQGLPEFTVIWIAEWTTPTSPAGTGTRSICPTTWRLESASGR